ncbi:putative NADPH:quinone oxidoreductase 1 [Acorus gramineus]|uniref:NAD(P)H dehydrogenase (quinone) n=1 Tax=Acorus gramineus TaxID=55184 RepID=A0AAV9BQQ7_ACOGR|nr:putative NADPH:quinone oxidoreductase 1 [Acorus gramineus]
MEAAAAAEDAKPVIRIAAICGSLRKASFNRGLIRAAVAICEESITGMKIDYIDVEGLPFYNMDLEENGYFPSPVEEFRKKIREADGVLFASPEYNYSVSPLLKNAIDWGSRPPNAWADKGSAIVSAGGSSAGARMQYHLRQIGVFLDLHFINKPELIIPAFQPPQKFDRNGDLIDLEMKERLKKLLLSLHAFILRLR